MKKYSCMLLMVFSTNALFSMSFLERQYKNVVNDIDLINRCYLKKKSCTAVERAEASHALWRVTDKGLLLLGTILVGWYALLRVSPLATKRTTQSRSTSAAPQYASPSQTQQTFAQEEEQRVLGDRRAFQQKVALLLPPGHKYVFDVRPSNMEENRYALIIKVPKESAPITLQKGEEIIEEINKDQPLIKVLMVEPEGRQPVVFKAKSG